MKVGEFCNRTVIVAEGQESAADVARLMRDHHVGCVVVVEDRSGRRKPVGIITDRDLAIGVIADNRDPARTPIEQIMSADPYRAREQQDLEDVLHHMRARGVRRIPVVDEHDVLLGIFTFDDLVEWSAEHTLELSHLVQRELHAEHDRRRT